MFLLVVRMAKRKQNKKLKSTEKKMGICDCCENLVPFDELKCDYVAAVCKKCRSK